MGKRDTTETAAPAQTPARGEFLWLDPAELLASDNPRRTPYASDRFTDLVQSVKTRGVLEPLIVRRLLDGIGYQVVAGDTRRRAAIVAGQHEVPCRALVLDDIEVLEVQLIENIQRESMHPLDEGEGFARLLTGGRSVETIAAKVGKSIRWVQQRIAFSKLSEPTKAAFLEGKFSASHAELLVRVDAATQAEALKFLIDDVGAGYATSVDELQDWMRNNAPIDVASPAVHAVFPELASAHDDAEADGAKLLQLSSAYSAPPAGVLSRRSWELATGKNQCALSERGVIVLGDNQGQVVTVCRNKGCHRHWPLQQSMASPSAPAVERREVEKKERDAKKRAREAERQEHTEKVLKAARPALIKYLAAIPVVPPAVVQRGLDRVLQPYNAEIKRALGKDPSKDPARAIAIYAVQGWLSPDAFEEIVSAAQFDMTPFDPDALPVKYLERKPKAAKAAKKTAPKKPAKKAPKKTVAKGKKR